MSRAAFLPAPAKAAWLAQSLGLALMLTGPALADPVYLDGRQLPTVQSRVFEGEVHLPLLAVAQALGQRVSVNRYTGTATVAGRELPVVLSGGEVYMAQSSLPLALGLDVRLQEDHVELWSPGTEATPIFTGDPRGPMEVLSVQPAVEAQQLVVHTRLSGSRSSTARVRVVLRRPDGQLYASFLSAPQRVTPGQESEVLVPTWISGGVTVGPDQSLQVTDYALRETPPLTYRLLVEASVEP